MRKNQLLSVLSLFLLVPASITRAQTTSGTPYFANERNSTESNLSPKSLTS